MLNLNRHWFDPRRSINAFSRNNQYNQQVMPFAERMEGIYRFVTGRLNRPQVIGQTSRNHLGLFDYLTLGVFYGVESFLRGNWIQSERPRMIVSILTSPIWLCLNLVRAAVGAVTALLAVIPAGIYQAVEVKREAQRVAALRQAAQSQPDLPTPVTEPPAQVAEQAKVPGKNPLTRLLQRRDSASLSQDGTTKVVLASIGKATDFEALESHPENTATSFWKIAQNKDGGFDARLRNIDGKDPIKKMSRYNTVFSNTTDPQLFATRMENTFTPEKAKKLGHFVTVNNNMMVATPNKRKLFSKDDPATSTYAYVPASIRK